MTINSWGTPIVRNEPDVRVTITYNDGYYWRVVGERRDYGPYPTQGDAQRDAFGQLGIRHDELIAFDEAF